MLDSEGCWGEVGVLFLGRIGFDLVKQEEESVQ